MDIDERYGFIINLSIKPFYGIRHACTLWEWKNKTVESFGAPVGKCT